MKRGWFIAGGILQFVILVLLLVVLLRASNLQIKGIVYIFWFLAFSIPGILFLIVGFLREQHKMLDTSLFLNFGSYFLFGGALLLVSSSCPGGSQVGCLWPLVLFFPIAFLAYLSSIALIIIYFSKIKSTQNSNLPIQS